jgi:hypothetical protein
MGREVVRWVDLPAADVSAKLERLIQPQPLLPDRSRVVGHVSASTFTFRRDDGGVNPLRCYGRGSLHADGRTTEVRVSFRPLGVALLAMFGFPFAVLVLLVIVSPFPAKLLALLLTAAAVGFGVLISISAVSRGADYLVDALDSALGGSIFRREGDRG